MKTKPRNKSYVQNRLIPISADYSYFMHFYMEAEQCKNVEVKFDHVASLVQNSKFVGFSPEMLSYVRGNLLDLSRGCLFHLFIEDLPFLGKVCFRTVFSFSIKLRGRASCLHLGLGLGLYKRREVGIL